MCNKTGHELHKPYNAMDVANYVVKHFIDEKQPIPNLLLLKILYYLQADSLIKYDTSLFSEAIEKWGYGPVIPEVYSNFKSYGPAPITSTIKYVEINDDGSWRLINPANRELEEQDKPQINALADEIYNKFWKNPFQLVYKTHEEPMWKKDEHKIQNGILHIPYSNDEIRDYFKIKGNWPWEN